ncbi:hypothetical protein BFP70_12065 [Thioclava sp. SK-1]|uniref:hypothetical protein n=1 Tax=Thioclava sp. SK-1 TaxID=1889770 RepID=UPI000826F1A2|nr:hypothetical protein [Thioclava sp. SK-1]OCX63735.1 hypothetical protein BFP70_12065 [Thioclava sp. SK-1]
MAANAVTKLFRISIAKRVPLRNVLNGIGQKVGSKKAALACDLTAQIEISYVFLEASTRRNLVQQECGDIRSPKSLGFRVAIKFARAANGNFPPMLLKKSGGAKIAY